MNDHQTIRVCVSICEQNLDSLQTASDRAIEWADLIELRLDCLDSEPESIPDSLSFL